MPSSRSRSRSRSRKQRGAGTTGAPLSYLDTKYQEPSASAGSNVLISEPGLARPVINPTGGSRRRRNKRGGFYHSVMANFVNNASRIVPVVAVTGYRMLKNYKTRKNRK
jgi:hypothetical protein